MGGLVNMSNIKVFISYYHKDDQGYKDELATLNKTYRMFIDNSVDTGDIDDEEMTDEQIRVKIRDEYIKDTDVFVLLCGKNTKHRKHIDWEIHAAMYKNKDKKPIPILILNLPSSNNRQRRNTDVEREIIENHTSKPVGWVTLSSYSEFKEAFPDLPERIVKSLSNKKSPITIVNYSGLYTNELETLIKEAYARRNNYEYDDSTPLRRKDGKDE